MIRLLLVGLLTAAAPLSAGDKKSQKELLEEKLEDLNELSERLNRYSMEEVQTPEREFLHDRVTELLHRARKEPPGYVYERLKDAIDDLLDASDDIGEAFDDEADDDDTQERSGRDLEKSYFDLHQAEYFAKQSKEPDAGAYVDTAKALYQQARTSHDQENYRQARGLASAAREVGYALESLAHAAVRIPTPPRLE